MPTNGWQHIQGYFSAIPSGTYSEAVIGFISYGGSALTNTVSYWIDDDFVSAGTPGQPYVLDAATWAKNTEP